MRTIIDSHCHIYPNSIARKAVKAIDSFYSGLPVDPYDGTVQTLLDTGLEAGISRFIVHSVATKPEQVSHINRFLAQTMNDSGGRFTALGTMHPDSLNLRKDFDELLALGLKGVKLHPDTQRFFSNSTKAMKIYEMCEASGTPVLLHTGDYRFDYSNPNRIEAILKTFPGLKLVGAHFGGWSVWEDAVKVLPAYQNFLVDTSSSFYWLKPERALEIIRAYGSGRVMFGTDYPMWQQKRELEYLNALPLTEEETENIYWKTCADLYGIEI